MTFFKPTILSAAAIGFALSFAPPADAQTTRQDLNKTQTNSIKGATPNNPSNAKGTTDIDIKAKDGMRRADDGTIKDGNKPEAKVGTTSDVNTRTK